MKSISCQSKTDPRQFALFSYATSIFWFCVLKVLINASYIEYLVVFVSGMI